MRLPAAGPYYPNAIVEIGRAGEISLNEPSEMLKLDKSTMSRAVNNLVVQDIHP